jgi:hypothetical protein
MRANGLIEFAATRHRGGYKLVTGLISPRSGKEPMRPVSILQPAVPRARIQRYIPPTDLCVSFARTELTDEAILRFASEFGPLGLPETRLSVRDGGAEQSSHYTMLRGEAIEAWRAEISAMNYALERWQLAQTAKPGARRLLKSVERSAAPMDRKQAAQEWMWVEPALAFDDCLETVNSAVPEKTFRLIKTQGLKAKLRVVPRNLKEFLWLQLAQTISVDAVVRQCANPSCRKWIVAVPETRAFRRTTCSDSCRSGAYQKRKAQRRVSSKMRDPRLDR